MKIKEKIRFRINLLERLIKESKFQFSDLIYFFKPGSWISQERIDELFFEKDFFKEESNGNLSFTIGDKAFTILPEMKYDAAAEILDFGKNLCERNISDAYNENLFSYEGPYEINECHLKENDYVVDAGANLGLFTVLVGDIVGDHGKVFAFEPVSETRQVLDQNIKQNNISNCQIIDFALGSSNEDVEISIDDNHLSSSSIVMKNKNFKRKETIKQTKLDDFVEKNKINKIDFLKADIEGAERDMLRGAEKTIKRFKPRIAICTYHLPDDPEVLEGILKEFVPEYNIVHKYKKMYAWV